ncbi:CsgG/HfaB family protein [Polaromonas sp.]|uniref:CsgG/HfaB family protein n=1 Tax=Polaromonas sp. TaxID=1869339 RepID=UPI0025EB5A9A|nr:CsgG/HfaB family protein [Polaromonas sp.]
MQRRLTRQAAQFLCMASLCLVSACSVTRVGIAVPASVNEPLLKGPAVVDVITPFDRALACLDGRINREALRFSVGSVVDATGKEQVTDGGSGKFVTQGAGDIVQSALFLAGAAVVNRRDPRIIDNEVKWGLLDIKQQAVSTFFVTGSINSLDFLPGSGFDLQIAGIGPRLRQNRILVGLDLSLTETRTGRIVANVPLQKQVLSTEDGFGMGRFFGNTLISMDVGGKEREALNLVLRQMLNLATFELLTQVMPPEKYADCMQLIEVVDGVTENSRSSRTLKQYLNAQAKAAELATKNQVMAAAKKPTVLEAASATPPARAPVQPGPALPAAAAQSADAQASAAQTPYFPAEQAQPSNAALQALNLSPGVRAPKGAPPGNSSYNGAGGGGERQAAAALVASAPAGVPACKFPPGDFAQVTPLRATEAGNSLRLRSRSAQTVCLADSAGRFTPRPLAAGVEQKFEGLAPWRLQAERMHELDIVFQGLPLRKPGYVKDRLELLERTVTAPAG